MSTSTSEAIQDRQSLDGERRIAVGLDRSRPSRSALRWALSRVDGNTRFTLVYVADPDAGHVEPVDTSDAVAEAHDFLNEEADYARSIGAHLTVETHVRNGRFVWELITASASFDLVVIGTHKTGFVRGTLFGSRGLQLAAAAKSAVAIIPDYPSRTRRGLAVGVDNSPAGLAAIRFASTEAAQSGQPLELIRAVDLTVQAGQAGIDAAEADARRTVAAGVEFARRCEPQVELVGRIVGRPAAEALASASRSAETLFLGASDSRRGHGAVLGSVCHDVLINQAGPIVVVHDNDLHHRTGDLA